MQFKNEINELKRARDLILIITERVPYMHSKAEGDAAKVLMQVHGIDSLVRVSTRIATYLNSFEPEVLMHGVESRNVVLNSPLVNYKSLTEKFNDIDTICGWLNDPYIHSGITEYRNAAFVNLEKAILQISSILDFITRNY